MNRPLSVSTESLLSSNSHSLFNNLDRDGNGFIERGELAEYCGSDVTEEEFARLFSQLDKDGDGRISLEDFHEGYRMITKRLNQQRPHRRSRDQLLQERRRSSVASSLSVRLQSRSESRENILSDLHDGEEGETSETTDTSRQDRDREQQQREEQERLTLSLSDCLQSLACQDNVLDLYQQLSEQQSERPQLLESFETVLAELIQTIRCLQSDQARLEMSMRDERERHRRSVRELESELEQQVAAAKEAAVCRAREAAEREFRAALEATDAELRAMTQQLVEQRNRLTAADALGVEVARLRQDLDESRAERKAAQAELIESETRLAVAMSDISALKQALQEREFSAAREREAVQEQLRRQTKIAQQLQAMHLANRELRDRNEELMQLQVSMDAASLPTATARSSTSDATEDAEDGGDLAEVSSSDWSGRRNFPMHVRLARQPKSILRATANPERMFKVVLAGDSSVGKSCFIMRLCDNKFVEKTTATLGVDFKTKVISVDGRVLAIQLWDTAGQERFRSIAKSYFRRADGVLLLYDCTHERSFLSVRDWVSQVRDVADVPIMICGNKIDLRPDETTDEEVGERRQHRAIGYAEARKLAQEHDALLAETSAKSGQNVEKSLAELARQMWANEDLQVSEAHLRTGNQQPGSVKLTQQKGNRGNKACCDS